MKQSLVKLIDVILKRIEEQPETLPTETGLRTWLSRQGYKKRDIEDAMRLVSAQFRQAQRVEEFRPAPMRKLSPLEEHKLTMDARAALARLENFGLIDTIEREMVLERLDQFEGPIGVEELDYLVSWIICGSRDYESQTMIYNVLDGKSNVYH